MLKIYKKYMAFLGNRKQDILMANFYAFVCIVFDSFPLVALGLALKAIIDNHLTTMDMILSLGIMTIGLIGSIFFGNIFRLRDAYGSFHACADKRIEIGQGMRHMPMGFFSKRELGALTAAMTTAIDDIQNIAPRIVTNCVQAFLHIFVTTLMITVVDRRIGGIVLVGILVYFFVNSRMQLAMDTTSENRVSVQEELIDTILEYTQGMMEIKSFGMKNTFGKKLSSVIDDFEKSNFDLEKKFIPYIGLQNLITRTTSMAMIVGSVYFFTSSTMPMSTAVFMVILSFVVFNKLELAGGFTALLQVVDYSIDKADILSQAPTMDIDGHVSTFNNHGIEFKDVSFAYEGQNILSHMNLHIAEGSTTAIIGGSGSGKTTICNLISRFWDVDKGAVTIGGIDVKDVKLDTLMAQMSMVFQDVYLFNDTIANNIRFGHENIPIEKVIEAAKKANCHDFIMSLPQGYDSILGEGGATISGGEKQRISIARAILKDTPIVILDEATANIDVENEALIIGALEELTKNKTTITIAHKLNTIKKADQIIAIDKGRIVQRGVHKDLIKEDGLYKRYIQIREKAMGWQV